MKHASCFPPVQQALQEVFLGSALLTIISSFSSCILFCSQYVLIVGQTHLLKYVYAGAGTGKTALMRAKLQAMNPESMCFNTINLNSFSDAPSVQTILEQPLEKKSGAPSV